MQQPKEKEKERAWRGEVAVAEAVVACSDKSMKIGATMWDIETGEKLLHTPTCASPPFGFLCLRNRFLVASQINKHGSSISHGTILIWPLNKPQQPLLNYTVEDVGPLCCTSDGIYLVGGALSGFAYLWSVTSGKLLKAWKAHNKSLNCMLFSDDNSFLISSSVDGVICVWSMISLLNVEETRSLPPLLHCLSGHMSSITGLLTTPDNYFSLLVSSSLDGTCKAYANSRLSFGNNLHCLSPKRKTLVLWNRKWNNNCQQACLEEGPSVVTISPPLELKGHNGAISALTCSQARLISASEDCMIYIWDIFNREVIQRFTLQKGKATNLVVVSRSSLVSTPKYGRVSNQYYVSPLNKYPEFVNSFEETTTLLSLRPLHEGNQTCIDLRSSTLLRQKISSSQKAHEPMTMATQTKVETSIQNCMWAANMAKHVMVINKQLQLQLQKLIQHRVLCSNNINKHKTRRKKLKIHSLVHEEENQKP